MTNVKIKFFHHEWDNYQGASGKVFEMEKIVALNDDVNTPPEGLFSLDF